VNCVGRYEITERLGQGGMGTVYRAFDPLLTRVVAVKVISAQLDSQPEQRERFFREARAAAQLSHRNIVTIFDLGEQDGAPFLAMEYLVGRDLELRMREGDRMTLARKLEIALMVCEGLAHAHGAGVIHRDIKPANIFITDDGQAKILDFGLARLVTSELTRSNMMVGTVNYMSPEQLRGEKSDHRADIFSFGVVIYELLSGKKPFQADSFASTMYKILNETPEALDRIDPSLPPHLTAIVDRAIAKSRDDRYQHMTELARDLATAYEGLRGSDMRVLSHITSRTPPPSHVQSRPLDQLTSPDAVTIATPVPSLIQTAAAVGTPPPTPFPATPLPQSAPAPSSTGASFPNVRPAPGTQRWVYVTLFGIALAGLSVFMLRDRTPQPAPTAPAAQVTPSAPAPPSGPPSPAPPGSGPQPAERPEIAERREPQERQEPQERREVAERPEPPEARPPEPSSRVAAEIAAQVARLNRQARAAFEAGRHEEAAQQAREVLALDRRNRTATELLARVGAAERQHVATALAGMDSAKAAAVAADARNLVPSLFSAAEQQEGLARKANDEQAFTTAAARMETATTLFKTAETGARAEIEARAARAQAAENRRRAEAAARPEPAPAPPPPAPASPPAPKPESIPAPAASPVKVQAAVAAVIDRYTSALQQRDLSALKAVWPTLAGAQQSAIESEFNNARSITVQFVDPKIDVSGSTATVTGVRRYGMQTRDGQQLRTETNTTVVLRQSANGWHIESVRHQAR